MIPQAAQQGIVVVGESTATAAPDVVTLFVGVQISGTTATQVQRDVVTRALTIAQALHRFGSGYLTLQTLPPVIVPIYVSGSQANPQAGGMGGYPYAAQTSNASDLAALAGYAAIIWVKAQSRDMSRVGEILDVAVNEGANRVGGVSFHLRDDSDLRRAALEQAGKNARLKAEALAMSIGKLLGDQVMVVEEMTALQDALGGAEAGESIASQGFGPVFGAGGVAVNGGHAASVLGEIACLARVRLAYDLE